MDIKEIMRLNENLEKINEKLDNNKINEYIYLSESKKKLFLINFISGAAKGLGYAVGFSILSGLMLYVIYSTIDMPIIGKYIAQLIDIVEIYRIK